MSYYSSLLGKALGQQYELRQLLKEGGMGAVFVAHQPRLRRDVAVKVLTPLLNSQTDYIERFAREAEMSAALEHAHIVPIYDYGVEDQENQDQVSYVVMRLLTGGSLAEKLRTPPEPFSQPALIDVAQVIKQLCSALDYAHARRVLHRDIKASNVMFDHQGSAFLVDFGIAKLLHSTSTITATGTAMGTPLYMSPEQWRGDPLTPASDQYALGVLAYEMVTGQVPFDIDTPHVLMYKHLHEQPEPMAILRDNVPDALEAVMRRVLAKDPLHRFPTMTDFARAFAAAVEGIHNEPAGFFESLPDTEPVNPLLHGKRVHNSKTRRVATPKGIATPPTGVALSRREAHSKTPPAHKTFYSIHEGDRLGEYRLHRRLDKGDKSRVYTAYHPRRSNPVALKVLGADATDEKYRARFEQEARILSSIHHPHIVPFLDYDTEDGVSYIVMPLLSGGSLKDRLERLSSPRDALNILKQIATALDYLHRKGVIHRDLKTTNILFDDQDNPFLVDFGIARVIEEGSSLSTWVDAGKSPIGSIHYMPPEQWMHGEISQAADQYALAVVAYQMLTGQLPFNGPPTSLMFKHLTETPPPPSSVRPQLSNDVDYVIGKALSKNAAERYPSVLEFVDELEQVLTTQNSAPGGTLFVSYALEDWAYVFQLAQDLHRHGFAVVLDEREDEFNSRRLREIEYMIDNVQGLLVVMSPDARDSVWVYKELERAHQRSKPIFPLLLKGRAFGAFIDSHYVDVTDHTLPDEEFYTRLRRTMTARRN